MSRRATHRLGVLSVTAALLAAGCGTGHRLTIPTCSAEDVLLTTEQAANASTIAAVGKRLGVPNHAVTIALATAFQESGMRNLDYGDRDSLGLFQQRPSQGWGTPEAIQDPRLASAAFYRRLLKVEGWATLSVTAAAQRVQRSAAPDAYGQWEDASRTLARALTGEVPAGIACRYDVPKGSVIPTAGLKRQAELELGPGGLARTKAPWVTAGWLVTHARTYHLTRISTTGHTWTAKSGEWAADPKATRLTWA
jgi:hypothetical protein